jgi:hypothetical protein
MRFGIFVLAMGLASSVNAHELVPTYPEMTPSFMSGVSVTTLQLFNRRDDVRFYVIDVYTEDWAPVDFATRDQVLEVNYLEKRTFDVYIRDGDVEAASYICTTSKLLSDDVKSTGLSSRICSRLR